MHSLSDSQIRSSFVNASLRERKSVTLPPDFDELDWERLDFVGWRDPKLPMVGYLVIPADDGVVGIMLRLGGRQPRNRPLCSFCEDVQLPNEVAFFSAKFAGAAGRKGNTVGTLICSNFECSTNVRAKPSAIFASDDVETVRQQRIQALRTHLAGFAQRVASGDSPLDPSSEEPT
ncbi:MULTISPECIES: FBP domain-containing protein [unclassified Gordonia (in: high G+C Gram-positive bacteria)]|uniref:FBP domain-containing protein n=1 Tax=unclassified Gordonia (in: high G+C Gram-positive bacteria) TaxID=2657482 RepID=UPI00071C4184|nr:MULTISPECIES: FBP domain-containing protein [unclassified Gordonia (in: high G+C Gram-positive bacteria)]KSU56581.1 translation elongation factor [Gordonia sp. SGD-V-85]SCC48793.1 FBP C-terminal treble-clef zinc-finger [Gordonia sp. v-85]